MLYEHWRARPQHLVFLVNTSVILYPVNNFILQKEAQGHVRTQYSPKFFHLVKTTHLPGHPSHPNLMDRDLHHSQNGIYLEHSSDGDHCVITGSVDHCVRGRPWDTEPCYSCSVCVCHFRHGALQLLTAAEQRPAACIAARHSLHRPMLPLVQVDQLPVILSATQAVWTVHPETELVTNTTWFPRGLGILGTRTSCLSDCCF